MLQKKKSIKSFRGKKRLKRVVTKVEGDKKTVTTTTQKVKVVRAKKGEPEYDNYSDPDEKGKKILQKIFTTNAILQ